MQEVGTRATGYGRRSKLRDRRWEGGETTKTGACRIVTRGGERKNRRGSEKGEKKERIRATKTQSEGGEEESGRGRKRHA